MVWLLVLLLKGLLLMGVQCFDFLLITTVDFFFFFVGLNYSLIAVQKKTKRKKEYTLISW